MGEFVLEGVRAPRSNFTLAPTARAGNSDSNRGSMVTTPVNQSEAPVMDGCVWALIIFIINLFIRI